MADDPLTDHDNEELKRVLGCCQKPELGSLWFYGFNGPNIATADRVLMRVEKIECVNCGTAYEVDAELPLEHVDKRTATLRIIAVRRKPS